MSVFCCGDVHGTHDILKLRWFKAECGNGAYNLTKDDYVIVCGDFGLLWSNPFTLAWNEEEGKRTSGNLSDDNWSEKELKLLAWYNRCPWTTLFVDGNHENFDRIDSYPVTKWHGGLVQKISNSVIHLMRGEIYDIDGHTFFCMGGAMSTDRGTATGTEQEDIHSCWWPQEIPSIGEWNHAFENLEAHGNKVDFIITHDTPAEVSKLLGRFDRLSEVSQRLEVIRQTVDFKHWFCGHMHEDKDFGKVHVLYKSMPVNVEDYGRFSWAENI